MTYESLRRCQRLDLNGRQCKLTGTHKEQYSGDSEIYRNGWDNEVLWVRVWLCEYHRQEKKKPRKKPEAAP